MKIRVAMCVAATAIGLCCPAAGKSRPCSQQEAKLVEETIAQVETWPQFATFYAEHKGCDVSALRYAFTQQVAHLAGNDSGLVDLSRVLTQNPRLKPTVLGHLKSEAVSAEDRDQILKVLKACQPKQTKICQDVRKALIPANY